MMSRGKKPREGLSPPPQVLNSGLAVLKCVAFDEGASTSAIKGMYGFTVLCNQYHSCQKMGARR